MEIQHTAIQVSNLEETRAFYEDGFGLEYAWDFHTDDGRHNYYVTGDNLDTWLQFVHDPDDHRDLTPAGIVHLALRVNDVKSTIKELVEKTNCPVLQEPTAIEEANAQVAFVEDPDGYEIEIFAPFDDG